MNRRESGAHVVVARSKEGNDELIRKLSGLGVEAYGMETIGFEEPSDWSAVDHAVAGIQNYDWLVFTSPRGVGAFLARLSILGISRRLGPPRLAAVGARTAHALEEAGFAVDFVPKDYLTSELAQGIPSDKGKRVLILRADIGDEAFPSSLRRRGFDVTDLAVYRTVTVAGRGDAERIAGARFVVFASPSEVRGFKSRVPGGLFHAISSGAKAVCIGPVTAEEARAAGFRSVITTSEHTVDALAERVREAVFDA